VVAADADAALAQLRDFHGSTRDKPTPCRHGYAAQRTPFFEWIDNEGTGLCALLCALFARFRKPCFSLFFSLEV
jgi:hypothetical protein